MLRILLILLLLSLPVRADEPQELVRPGAGQQQELPRLDAVQQQWLGAHLQWRAGVVLEVPFAQLDERKRQLYGAHIELTEQLADLYGARLSWQYFSTQTELEQALDAGRIDLAPGQTQTADGLRSRLYSEPYLRVAYLVLGERREPVALDLERLGRHEALALDVPDSVIDYLASNYPSLQLVRVRRPQDAVHALLSGRARYAVVDEAQLVQMAREVELEGLTIAGDLGVSQLLRVATRRDLPQLAGIIDAGLLEIPAKQLDQLHRRWLQPPSHSRLQQDLSLWRTLSQLLLISLVISLVMLFIVRRKVDGLESRLLAARREVELRDSSMEELRLAQFSIDHSTVGILWVNWDSHVRYAKEAVERMLGYASGEVVGRPLSDFKPDLHMDNWLTLWRQARAGDCGPLNFETQYLHADGSLLQAEMSLSFLRYGKREYLVVFITDVTERHRALAALEESENRLRSVSANVPGVVFRLERPVYGGPAEFAFLSDGSESLVGYPAASLRQPGWGIFGLVHPEEREAYRRIQTLALDSHSDWHWQGRLLTRSGEPRWVDIKAIARVLDGQRVVWDGIVWDIHDNKQIELALAESREQLRDLAAHLESVREEEKAHIAREVHDEFGQVLTGIKLETSMCEYSYGNLDPGLSERLANMKRQITHLFQLVRDLATALRPPILDAGLASAIEWQARRFEARSQISCLVEVPEQLPALSDARATGLFRILQEALTNISRHAAAQSVHIRLCAEAGTLCLSISDDGCGFVVDGERPRSFGLVGMHERALMMSGSLHIDSQPGEGTTLTVRVPLDNLQLPAPAGATTPGDSA